MADEELGGIVIRIKTDAAKAMQGLKNVKASLGKTKDSLQGLRDGLNNNIKTWAKWSTGIVASAATAGIAITKAQVGAIRELKNMADVTGLSVAAFQQQSFAVKQAGIEQEKYSDILKDVNDRIGDYATAGSGPMADFFEKIAPKVGVTIEQFQKLSSSEGLQLYVSSLEKANVSQKEMTFFMEAIAGDATKLLPLLKNNGEGMNKLAQEAKDLGIGLSDIDVASAVEVQKKFDALSEVMDSQLKNAVVELTPLFTVMLEDIIDLMVELDKESKDAMGGMMSMAEKVVKGIGYVVDGFHVMKIGIKTLAVAVTGLSWPFVQVLNVATKLYSFIIDKLIAGVQKVIGMGSALADFIGAEDPFKNWNKSLGNARDNIREAEATVQSLTDSHTESLKEMGKELMDATLQGLPSEKILAKFEEWKKRSVELSNEIKKEVEQNAADSAEGMNNDALGSLTADEFKPRERKVTTLFGMDLSGLDDLESKISDETDLILEMLGLRELSKHELLLMSLQEEQRIRDEAYKKELESLDITEQEKAELRRQYNEETERNVRMTEATKKALVLGGMNDLLGTLAKQSKTALKVQKAFNLAQAGMAIATGIAKAQELGFPANIAEMARVVAVGSKAIASIKSANMGSAKVPAVGGSGGISASASAPPVQSSQPAGNRKIDISMSGQSLFTSDMVRDLIEKINTEVGDGVQLAVGV